MCGGGGGGEGHKGDRIPDLMVCIHNTLLSPSPVTPLWTPIPSEPPSRYTSTHVDSLYLRYSTSWPSASLAHV